MVVEHPWHPPEINIRTRLNIIGNKDRIILVSTYAFNN